MEYSFYSFTCDVVPNLLFVTCFFYINIQKLKTRVVKHSVNPEWNDDLTLSVTDPNLPIKLVSDHYL